MAWHTWHMVDMALDAELLHITRTVDLALVYKMVIAINFSLSEALPLFSCVRSTFVLKLGHTLCDKRPC
jgi:hypothetical protein